MQEKWGQIELEWIDLIDAAPDQKCIFQRKYENLISLTKIGSPVKDIFYYCSPAEFAKILGVSREELFRALPKYLISTASSSASNFL